MDVIYIDSLFLLNLIIDYFILLATAKVCSLMPRRGRYALSAIAGAGYAVLCALPPLSFLNFAPLKLALGTLLCLIAFGGEKRFLRVTVSFFLVSAAFGGAVFAASLLAGKPILGGVYLSVSLKVLILSFALAYAVLSVVFRRISKRAERVLNEIEAEYRGKSVKFRALADTGNELHDPLTGCGVLIAERETALRLLPLPMREILEDDTLSPIEMLVKLGPGMRLIPYAAVGVERSLLLGFKPDALRVDGAARDDLLIALSPTRLSEAGEYEAVL
ncbi:MAG: sigma-E processing peptidase SpoIIGA [Firmicutes bacterium]|nr:sigma-E processing peptidase SpoIIGA [Bacillota bacterium]